MLKSLQVLLIVMTLPILGFGQYTWRTELSQTISWSSGRAIDLTQDGVKDFVIGAGAEFIQTDYGYLAFDGVTGDTLWNVSCRDQIFSSPTFLDITEDGVPEVFMGGRSAELKAINGATGDEIWEFFTPVGNAVAADSGLYNFYGSVVVPDQNNDGFEDLLISNGGDALAQPSDPDRPIGNLMIISSVDGEEIARASMPDGAETYCTPVVSMFNDDTLRVVYGTGGETLPGSLWRCKLSDVMNEDLSVSERLDSSSTNGYVAPPSLVDLNGDGILDIVANNYDDRLFAIDGLSKQLIWEKVMPNAESNVNPSIGYFNEDNVPDIHTTVAIGEWLIYSMYIRYTIDGTDGSVLDSTIFDWMNFSSSVAMDVNNDGYDELLTLSNLKRFSLELNQDVFEGRLMLEDKVGGAILYDTTFTGSVMVSTPMLDDLDDDGLVDILFNFSSDSLNPFTSNGLTLCRVELPYSVPEYPSWTSYHGTFGDGHFNAPPLLVAVSSNYDEKADESFYKWASNVDESEWSFQLIDLSGRIIASCENVGCINQRLQTSTTNVYVVRCTSAQNKERDRYFKIVKG